MKLATFIDHTLLRADSTLSDIQKLCEEATQFGFATVCVPPYYVGRSSQLLEKKTTRVATVIGFPMGYTTTVAKVEEIKRAIDEGVDELDVVVNVSAIKSGEWIDVQNDLDRMITTAHLRRKLIKVILETGLLTPAEIKRACEICQELKPDFVKTSTGFNGEGATIGMVKLLRENLSKEIKIKASGGIRTLEDALRLIEAGAVRLGTSSSVRIMKDFAAKQ
ncbi:MAG: deoxyribose-phosphate aldolase [Saprospiraceae bacterium]